MAVCQLTSNLVLTASDVQRSVSSYVGSKTYLRKIVPLSIINILYHRSALDRKLFEEKSVENFNFVVFNDEHKIKATSAIHKWSKNAMDAMQKNFLKCLFFIIIRENTHDVLETYRYQFEYNKKHNMKTTPSSADVLQSTINFFDAIKVLGEFGKLPKDIDFKIELTFYEGAPDSYKPPLFELIPNKDQILHSKALSKELPEIGSIRTGFHSLECCGSTYCAAAERTDQNRIELEIYNVEEGIVEKIFYSEDENKTKDGGPVNVEIDCACGLQINFKGVNLVRCPSCKCIQHAACMNFLNEEVPPRTYVCTTCAEIDTTLKFLDPKLMELEQKDRKLVCLYRLILMYTYNTMKVGYEILNFLDIDTQHTLWSKLKNRVYFIEEGLWYVKSKEDVKAFIMNMFQKEGEN